MKQAIPLSPVMFPLTNLISNVKMRVHWIFKRIIAESVRHQVVVRSPLGRSLIAYFIGRPMDGIQSVVGHKQHTTSC